LPPSSAACVHNRPVSLKTELADKQLEQHSFGFPLYTVGQCADILAFRADLVPVGEDQVATIEMCREVARRFERVYGGAVFLVPEVLLGRVARLAGTDGVHKMSKSLGNAIFLSDSRAEIGDGALKAEVADAVDAVLAPMRERRAAYDGPRGEAAIVELLREHARHASAVADETLAGQDSHAAGSRRGAGAVPHGLRRVTPPGTLATAR
jgi:tryptophanyl-tRNA synthetase